MTLARAARAAAAMVLLSALAGTGSAALANEAAPAVADPALEARVMQLSTQLRCLVCQNQSIADSNADLAVDLRTQVRDMLRAGRSDAEVFDYMTARYGDFVLYKPPLRVSTLALWFGPLLLLLAGVGTLAVVLVRRNRLSADRFEADPADEEAFAGGARTPP